MTDIYHILMRTIFHATKLRYQFCIMTLTLEQKRVGAGKVILEDPDSVSIMDMVKEKLHGQMMAGLLRGNVSVILFADRESR